MKKSIGKRLVKIAAFAISALGVFLFVGWVSTPIINPNFQAIGYAGMIHTLPASNVGDMYPTFMVGGSMDSFGVHVQERHYHGELTRDTKIWLRLDSGIRIQPSVGQLRALDGKFYAVIGVMHRDLLKSQVVERDAWREITLEPIRLDPRPPPKI